MSLESLDRYKNSKFREEFSLNVPNVGYTEDLMNRFEDYLERVGAKTLYKSHNTEDPDEATESLEVSDIKGVTMIQHLVMSGDKVKVKYIFASDISPVSALVEDLKKVYENPQRDLLHPRESRGLAHILQSFE